MPTKKILMKALEIVDRKMGCTSCPLPRPCGYEKIGCSSNWLGELLKYAEATVDEPDWNHELTKIYLEMSPWRRGKSDE